MKPFQRSMTDADANELSLREDADAKVLHVMTTRSRNRGLTWPRLTRSQAARLARHLARWAERGVKA